MDCLFCKIADKTIPAKLVYEDEQLLGFEDINPRAPYHILLIPRKHIATLNDLTDEDTLLIGQLVQCAKTLAHERGLSDSGYRLVWNCNADAGQEVFHIHLHLLGGRTMTWPPG